MSFRPIRPHLTELEEKWKGATAVPTPPKTGTAPAHAPAKMDSNENPYGPDVDLPDLLEGLDLNRYPDAAMEELRERIGEFAGADPDRVVIGNGCDELIDLLIRLTVEPGEAIVQCPPTFIMFRRFAEVHGTSVIDAPLDREYQVDPDAVRRAVENSDAPARVLFLCNPNNPTGTTVPSSVVERLIDLPLWIVSDETYFGFCEKTLIDWTTKSEKAIVLRSLSKAYGLAGIRFGYGIFPPDLARLMRMTRPPYSVNRIAQRLAAQVLENVDTVSARFRKILSERERLASSLEAASEVAVVPSDSNYLFCETSASFQERLQTELAKEAVSIRFLATPYAEAAFRVTAGTPEQNDRFLKALENAAS